MTYEILSKISGLSGLLYFIAIFAGVLVYALWPKNQKRFEDAAAIPLRED